MDHILEQLVAAIRQRYGRETDAGTTLSSLGVDSLQMADLASDIERGFGIEIDQDVFEARSVGELADYIRSRRTG